MLKAECSDPPLSTCMKSCSTNSPPPQAVITQVGE